MNPQHIQAAIDAAYPLHVNLRNVDDMLTVSRTRDRRDPPSWLPVPELLASPWN